MINLPDLCAHSVSPIYLSCPLCISWFPMVSLWFPLDVSRERIYSLGLHTKESRLCSYAILYSCIHIDEWCLSTPDTFQYMNIFIIDIVHLSLSNPLLYYCIVICLSSYKYIILAHMLVSYHT